MTDTHKSLPLLSKLGPSLETKRLILRPPVEEDFPHFCAFHRDELAMKHLGGVTADAITWRAMRSIAGAWALDGFHMFSVLYKETGEWIGRVGPLYPHGWPDREVGWGILSSHWGQGFAREASLAAMTYVFEALNWSNVIHTIAPDNGASQSVAKFVGSHYIRPTQLPEPYQNVAVEMWGQSSEDWFKGRPQA